MSDVIPETLSIAITGSGGSGALTTGQIFLHALADAGLYGLLARSAGPQIRGGESAAMLRFGPTPVGCMDDTFQILIGLDWLNVTRFVDEIPLGPDSLIIGDPANGEVPPQLLRAGSRVIMIPLRDLAAQVPHGRANMLALGPLGALCGLPREVIEASIKAALGRKGAATVEAAIQCLTLGYAQEVTPLGIPLLAQPAAPERWNISGNEACGLGALRAGIRFVAAYPITPATEILEWMAPRLDNLGGALLQAEDELASINMIIGASFGGVPALTATSGPGLALMLEGMGLAVTSETPVTVIDVMRGGPSTGIPTKSEQSDLNIALYGLHGDAPHLVLAPLGIADCAFTTEYAVYLAEHLQALAVLLSDQLLGQSRSICDPPPRPATQLQRRVDTNPGGDYQRYRLDLGPVSPMTLPGTPQGMYTADGLEHNERGTPSSFAADHLAQLDKRAAKLHNFDYGDGWGECSGNGQLALVTWGSSHAAVLEAAARLRGTGQDVRVIALRVLAPLDTARLSAALSGSATVWVIEQNHGGQLFHYLKSQDALPAAARSLARPGPLPLRPGEIIAALGAAQEN